jgi:prepilin peptidase CpaA
MDSASFPMFANLLLAVQCCIAAYMDFRHRQLSNLLCLSVLGTGIGAGWFMHDLAWVGWSLAHGGLALLVGFALFAGKVIGGGDAKFYAALAVWLPLKYGFFMLGSVAFCGFILALAWFPLRVRIAALAPDPEAAKEFRKVPFGLAIATGGWLTHVVSSGLWSVQS